MLPLFKHQQEMLRELGEREYFAVFAEQGTGKTLPMLAHILRLARGGSIDSALVVCPKAVRGSWERDIANFFGRFDQLILRRILTITTYDLIWRRAELDRPWGLICLDESHFIKSRTSNRFRGAKRTKGRGPAVQSIGRKARYRYIMTGTPIGNSHYEEIWAQYDFLSPSIFGRYADFEDRYCILNQFYKPWKYIRTDELKQIIAQHSVSIKKIDCLDLPEKLPPERYTLDLLERQRYREMLKNYIAEFDLEAKNTLARRAKLRQMCSGFVIGESGEVHRLKSEKAEALDDFLAGWEKKLVIFAEFKESIAAIRAALTKRKIKHLVLDGAQKDKTIWKAFQSDENIRVIVCQYRTASAGIDLFAADTLIFWEPTESSQVFEQACDRIHRVGQKRSCSYILFETAGTVEVKMWDALMMHRDFNDHEWREFAKTEGRELR